MKTPVTIDLFGADVSSNAATFFWAARQREWLVSRKISSMCASTKMPIDLRVLSMIGASLFDISETEAPAT